MAKNGPGRQVVGGRVSGVGVGGFIVAGGGYSWLSNQYGLVIDTILSMQVVLPSGEIVTASESENSDLFFAVRGGGNNFCIVTSITAKTFPSGPNINGGLSLYGPEAVDRLAKATSNFSATNRDPKANVLPTFNAVAGIPGVVLLSFYDGETVPEGTFAAYGKIPIKKQSWLSFIKSAPADATAGQR